MTDDLDQILLLLVGVFAVFIVMLVVLARTEARLDNPPVQNSWARRRWHRPRVVAGTRARAAAGKETADRWSRAVSPRPVSTTLVTAPAQPATKRQQPQATGL